VFVPLNVASANDSCSDGGLCLLESVLSLNGKIAKVVPSETPDWYKNITTFSYSVQTRGDLTANLDEFKSQVYETLNSNEGWIRLGLRFKQVSTGGDFIMVLAEDVEVPSFAPGSCSADWSCRVGTYIIINQTRWLDATDAWNGAGGSLRDYRHMVVNHEVGHWLGHGHIQCIEAGQPAPIMQQQSIDLRGCSFNPWPLDSELWTTRL